jgi:phage shock protein C
MQNSQPSLPMRDDTFFGVCQGLGEDFGFNPVYLRVAFAVLLLWNAGAAILAYALAGAIVALGRRLFPNPRAAETGAEGIVEAPSRAEQEPLARDKDPEEYSVAA